MGHASHPEHRSTHDEAIAADAYLGSFGARPRLGNRCLEDNDSRSSWFRTYVGVWSRISEVGPCPLNLVCNSYDTLAAQQSCLLASRNIPNYLGIEWLTLSLRYC